MDRGLAWKKKNTESGRVCGLLQNKQNIPANQGYGMFQTNFV